MYLVALSAMEVFLQSCCSALRIATFMEGGEFLQ